MKIGRVGPDHARGQTHGHKDKQTRSSLTATLTGGGVITTTYSTRAWIRGTLIVRVVKIPYSIYQVIKTLCKNCYNYINCILIFTDHFSGPGRAIGPVGPYILGQLLSLTMSDENSSTQ